MRDTILGFQIWRSARAIRRFCLPAHGTRIVHPGALMLPSTDLVVASFVPGILERRGPDSTAMDCPKAIGDALASMLRPTASASTRSFKQKKPGSIVLTMVVIHGLWKMPIHVSPAAAGISIESPSIPAIPM